MIAQSMDHSRNMNNSVHSVLNIPGILHKSAFAESCPKMIIHREPERATNDSSDVFKRYLEGIRYLARKKQRRCISQELG